MEAIQAIQAKKDLERIVKLKRDRPRKWSEDVNRAYKRLEKVKNVILKIEPLLEERERNEIYQILATDPIVDQKVLKHGGKVIGKRVVRESGEMEDVLPDEYLSPVLSSGHIKASTDTVNNLKEREKWLYKKAS